MNPPKTEDLTPDGAIKSLCREVRAVGIESIALASVRDRILGATMSADRDSPPCDVSSMDGYAVRICDVEDRILPVCGESVPGRPPPVLVAANAVRIVTGAPLPLGADAVIPIEQIDEAAGTIQIKHPTTPLRVGQNIRRRGENLAAGKAFASAGELLTPAVIAAIAAFGSGTVAVHRRIRIAIVNTGQELIGIDEQPSPWQIRDSNGPSIAALLGSRSWIDCVTHVRVPDEPEQIEATLSERLAQCDAVILTGAVSVGPYDHVPGILRKLGCNIVFHRLPIRPGKPVLGAIGPGGQVVFGLPGNPVSALVCARRIALPVLEQMAGVVRRRLPATMRVVDDRATIPLWWFRLVRSVETGRVEPVETHGSGDLVSLARSDGFVEIPPNQSGEGPWPYYSWSA